MKKAQYVLTIDGFLVTDNVTVEHAEVVDTAFRNSDHNPVRMKFLVQDNRVSTPG